ncbi:MAG: SDR family NAD(P)-dependent oxidoreductase [Clostridia bacterium]|nr:SDR family NAD(P)-dependent oxidoreductase [Clostridia bacterium]
MDKYVLITGATGGLGRAYVEECARRKHNLILTSRSEQKLQELKEYIGKTYKDIVILTKTCDLAVESSRNELIDFIKENKLDIERLILNAGHITQNCFKEIKQSDYLATIRVNCEGDVDLFNKILKLKKQGNRFYTIVVSSFASFNPMPYMAIYSASKAFITSFFLAIREELKDENVFITVVCPSGMATTQEMKNAIKVQGIGGKITENSVDNIAKISIDKNLKNKPLIVVGFVNKLLHFLGAFVPQTVKAKMIGKRWKKAQEKLKNITRISY